MKLARDGANPVWVGLVLVYVLGMIGLDIYWLVTESGPVAYLADLQASILRGVWYPKLTFALLLLAELLPVLIAKVAVEQLTGKKLA
jgi:hypothetical protein